jgi:hypothetical protein
MGGSGRMSRMLGLQMQGGAGWSPRETLSSPEGCECKGGRVSVSAGRLFKSGGLLVQG